MKCRPCSNSSIPRQCLPDTPTLDTGSSSGPRTLLSGDVRLVPELGCVLDKVHRHVLITCIICKTKFKNSNCEGRFFIATSHLKGT